MSNTGIYQWFCLWRWWKMCNSGCVFCFLCVLPQRQAIFVKMPWPPRMHLWDPMCLFPQRRAFFTRWLVLPTTWPLECHTVETSYHAQHVWISIANCGYAKVFVWLRAEWLWNISFHLRPAAVNGACVNTQGSVSKSFCALEFPSTMVYKEMFRTALFCYLWVAGSTICQQARRFSIWVFTHKSKCSGSFNFSVALRGLAKSFSFGVSQWKDHDLPWPFIFRSSLHHAIPLFIDQVSTHAKWTLTSHPTPPTPPPKWRSSSVAWSASEDHLA